MILKLGYLALSLIMTLLLIGIAKNALYKTFNKQMARKKLLLVVLGLLAWHLYILLMGTSGFLNNFEFPPRFALFLILPAFLFTGIFAYLNRNNAWLQNVPPSWLVYYQSFRILIETLFVFTVAAGILHKNVTIEGYNYDMVFGYSAPIIGYLFSRNIIKYRNLAIAWNYLGLAVIAFIIFLFMSTIYTPSLYGEELNLMPMEFTNYPYVIVAAFLMPSAVFVHVLSLTQLHTLKQ